MASDPTLLDPKPAERRYLRATLAGLSRAGLGAARDAGGLLALVWFLLDQRPELAQLLLERIVIACSSRATRSGAREGPQFVKLQSVKQVFVHE